MSSSHSVELAKQKYARDLAAYTHEKWQAARRSLELHSSYSASQQAMDAGSIQSGISALSITRDRKSEDTSPEETERGRPSRAHRPHTPVTPGESLADDERGGRSTSSEVRVKDYGRDHRNQ